VQKERRAAAKGRRKHVRRRTRRREQIVRYGRLSLALVLVAAIIGGIWFMTGRERRAATAELGDLVVSEPSLGRNHVASTTTDPAPTSGDHLGPAVCGVVLEPLSADVQIHSLEHGSVLFQYRQADVSEEDIAALEQLAHEFGSHVTVAPNPRLPEPFVATAWTRRMELPAVDIDLARSFAVAFRERGPERVDCDV
jgi:hypothetical protein